MKTYAKCECRQLPFIYLGMYTNIHITNNTKIETVTGQKPET